MALSILDGNQSATTLSTIVTSGQHIPAHTVVSLGTQAISNITSAVSGTSVTFGLVGGTVTANNFTLTNVLQYDGSHYFLKVGGVATTGGTSFPVYVAGSVTANPTGTQTIAGTVTANGGDFASTPLGAYPSKALRIGYADDEEYNAVGLASGGKPLPVVLYNTAQDAIGSSAGGSIPLVISGTVTIGAGTSQIGSVTASNLTSALLAYSGGNSDFSVNIKSVGGQAFGQGQTWVPVAIAEGSLPPGTNRIGVVTIGAGTVTIGAGTSQIGSVTVGNSVTIGSLPAISGTVTANTFALQGTAVTTSNFTSTTASTVLANYNATREVLTIFNEGAGNLHIAPGATCTTIAYQVRLSAGDYYEVPNHQTTITHSAVFATAGTARVTQIS